jgi:hypothetical protein
MSSYVSELRYGLVLVLVSLAWNCFEYAIGLHTTRIELHQYVTFVFVVFPVVIMWKALVHRRDVIQGGTVTWGQGIASGVVLSLVPCAFGAPQMYVFTKFVNPGFFAAMSEYAVKTGQATPEEAAAYFNLKSYAIQASIFPLAAGLVTAVILTAIARRKNKAKPAAPAAAAG